MTINTTRWDSAEYLKTEEDVQLYLEACLEEAGDDPAFIAHALGVIARSKVSKADMRNLRVESVQAKVLESIGKIRSNNRIYEFHEAQTKQTIILQILDALGWNIFDDQEVKVECNVENGIVDYILKTGGRRLFIEAKMAPDRYLEDHQEQLYSYFGESSPNLAILTNGILWRFYLPMQEVDCQDIKFYTIDLLRQDQKIEDIGYELQRLLSRENIESGAAFSYYKTLSKESNSPLDRPILKKFENKITNLPEELGAFNYSKWVGSIGGIRYRRVWLKEQPWEEWRLSYQVCLDERSKHHPSVQIGLLYKRPFLKDFNEELFDFVRDMVQNKKVYEDQQAIDIDSWGSAWTGFTYAFVRRRVNSWDDEFVNTIAKTLRCFVETYTSEIEECWFQCNQQNT